MASNHQDDSDTDGSEFSDSGSDSCTSDTSTKDSGSFIDSDCDSDSSDKAVATTRAAFKRKICRYYNDGHCRNGNRCQYEHICKNHVEGSCPLGIGCPLKHSSASNASPQPNEHPDRESHGRRQRRNSSPVSADDEEDDDRPYRWQLNLGDGWQDVSNDFVLEAQYSRPEAKGINIYNTPAGVISIDFNKMRVLTKTNIKVRRKGSKQNEWLWYYRGKNKWHQFGVKRSKGKSNGIQSSRLEKEYQKHKKGSFQFAVDSNTFEISFKGMYQKSLSTGQKRRVRRRPKYDPSKAVASTLPFSFRDLMASVWQFEGRGGKWHTFKKMNGCSVSSDDIEGCYQSKQKTMTFTVNGDPYTLDFSRMNQVNHRTNARRKIRRT
nr:protein mono-ADP-ribosyltransferase PARP12 [Misgurnus anguillicaudatus]